jgi:hypothetical protein
VIADEPGVLRLPALVKGEWVHARPLSFDVLHQASPAPAFGLEGAFVLREPAPQSERSTRFLVFPRPDPRALVEGDPSRLAATLHSLSFAEVLDFAASLREVLQAARAEVQESVRLVGAGAYVDPAMLALVFDVLPELFNPEGLAESVDRELGGDGHRGREYLDGWVGVEADAPRGMTARFGDFAVGFRLGARPFRPAVRATPTRQLHITAGNSPLLPLVSFIRGLSTKGACVVKSPAEASLATAVVGAAMRAVDPAHPITRHTSLLYWPGGDRSMEDALFAPGSFDRVVVWGAADTVASVRARTPLTKTVALNPRYGVSLIAESAGELLEEAAARGSIDTLIWEQQACTASLVHYVEGDEAAAVRYARALAAALARWDEKRRRPLPRSLQGKIRLLRRGEWVRGTWFENAVGGELSSAVVVMPGSVDLSLHPMSRLVVVKAVPRIADVAPTLSAAVASAGVFPEGAIPRLRDPLASVGVSSVLPLGEGERTYPGIPHDGMRVLSELVNWTNSVSGEERSHSND